MYKIEDLCFDCPTIAKPGNDIVDPQFSTFKAYPDAKNIKLKFSFDKSNKDEGGYNEKTNTLSLNLAYNENSQKIRETTSHEIQHFIQAKEDFTRGSSIEREGRILSRSLYQSEKDGENNGRKQNPSERTLLDRNSANNYNNQYGEMEARASASRLD